MSLLNCLKDFVPSESNLYSEDEMRDINIRVLEERGVTVDDIAQLAYGTQSKYLDDLTIEEMKNSVLDVLGKRLCLFLMMHMLSGILSYAIFLPLCLMR